MNSRMKVRADLMNHLYTTLLFISERTQIVYTMTTANAFESRQRTLLSVRDASNTVRLSARVDIDDPSAVHMLIANLYAQFLNKVPGNNIKEPQHQ